MVGLGWGGLGGILSSEEGEGQRIQHQCPYPTPLYEDTQGYVCIFVLMVGGHDGIRGYSVETSRRVRGEH